MLPSFLPLFVFPAFIPSCPSFLYSSFSLLFTSCSPPSYLPVHLPSFPVSFLPFPFPTFPLFLFPAFTHFCPPFRPSCFQLLSFPVSSLPPFLSTLPAFLFLTFPDFSFPGFFPFCSPFLHFITWLTTLHVSSSRLHFFLTFFHRFPVALLPFLSPFPFPSTLFHLPNPVISNPSSSFSSMPAYNFSISFHFFFPFPTN